MPFVKGYKPTEEHRRRNSEAKKGKPSPRKGMKQPGAHLNLGKYSQKGVVGPNKGKRILKLARENNAAWKGDSVGYFALHSWIRRNYGKADHCSFNKYHTGRFEWANVSGSYLRDIGDWTQLCSSCHHQYDSLLRPKLIIRDEGGRFVRQV